MSSANPDQGPLTPIVTDAEGQEWVGMFRLPPDNDELWDPPRATLLEKTHYIWRGDELVGAHETRTYFPPSSAQTNAGARAANLALMRAGSFPLWGRPDDIPLKDDRKSLLSRILSRIR